MLTIKTDFQFNDYFLNGLLCLVDGEIRQISSWETAMNVVSLDKPCDSLLVLVSVKDKCHKLSVGSISYYNENIDDDVTTLKMSIEDCNTIGISSLGKQPFIIQKIQIYGEERIRVWSEIKKINYFHERVDIAIADYYFNNNIVRFESCDGRFVNIFAYRNMVNINFDENLNLERDFYLVSELDMGKELIEGEVLSNIQRIKCHYEIDGGGIRSHINQ